MFRFRQPSVGSKPMRFPSVAVLRNRRRFLTGLVAAPSAEDAGSAIMQGNDVGSLGIKRLKLKA